MKIRTLRVRADRLEDRRGRAHAGHATVGLVLRRRAGIGRRGTSDISYVLPQIGGDECITAAVQAERRRQRRRGRSTCARAAAAEPRAAPSRRPPRRPDGRGRGGPAAGSRPPRRRRGGPGTPSQNPSTSSSTTGLAWRPSWLQVRISQSSSKVPRPPGRATKASARSAISALRSCIEAVTRSSVSAVVGDLLGHATPRGSPDHLAAGRQRGVGHHAHQADVAAAVDERRCPCAARAVPSSAAAAA